MGWAELIPGSFLSVWMDLALLPFLRSRDTDVVLKWPILFVAFPNTCPIEFVAFLSAFLRSHLLLEAWNQSLRVAFRVTQRDHFVMAQSTAPPRCLWVVLNPWRGGKNVLQIWTIYRNTNNLRGNAIKHVHSLMVANQHGLWIRTEAWSEWHLQIDWMFDACLVFLSWGTIVPHVTMWCNRCKCHVWTSQVLCFWTILANLVDLFLFLCRRPLHFHEKEMTCLIQLWQKRTAVLQTVCESKSKISSSFFVLQHNNHWDSMSHDFEGQDDCLVVIIAPNNVFLKKQHMKGSRSPKQWFRHGCFICYHAFLAIVWHFVHAFHHPVVHQIHFCCWAQAPLQWRVSESRQRSSATLTVPVSEMTCWIFPKCFWEEEPSFLWNQTCVNFSEMQLTQSLCLLHNNMLSFPSRSTWVIQWCFFKDIIHDANKAFCSVALSQPCFTIFYHFCSWVRSKTPHLMTDPKICAAMLRNGMCRKMLCFWSCDVFSPQLFKRVKLLKKMAPFVFRLSCWRFTKREEFGVRVFCGDIGKKKCKCLTFCELVFLRTLASGCNSMKTKAHHWRHFASVFCQCSWQIFNHAAATFWTSIGNFIQSDSHLSAHHWRHLVSLFHHLVGESVTCFWSIHWQFLPICRQVGPFFPVLESYQLFCCVKHLEEKEVQEKWVPSCFLLFKEKENILAGGGQKGRNCINSLQEKAT